MHSPVQYKKYLSDDCYPSRNGTPAQTIRRLDPVVYAPESADCPVPEVLIQQYQEQGFMVLEDLFSEEEVAALNKQSGNLRTNLDVSASENTITEKNSGDVRSIFQIHKIDGVFQKLSRDPRLVAIAKYLLGDEVYLHQSRLNYKPGFRGKEFYWHSDFETWHVEDGMPRMRALSMSITLTENHDCNGPLMLIPGSHRHYLSCTNETPDNHFKDSLKKQEYGVPEDEHLSELVNQGGIFSAVCKPGSVIIFDCNTMHGSNGNITPFSRSNLFFVYNAISNRVVEPFSKQPPRPEYICTREEIKPV